MQKSIQAFHFISLLFKEATWSYDILENFKCTMHKTYDILKELKHVKNSYQLYEVCRYIV